MRPHSTPPSAQTLPSIRLGLRSNWEQFTLLVMVNAFVGGMVGLERAVLPLLAEHEFGLVSKTAILSFIVSFGLTKALANVLAGWLGDRIGRRRVLIAGWLFGLPVPILVMLAPAWSWVIAANVLLGINQGLCWSTTVIMKIDLVGPQRRGLAMGLNEAAGYLAVSLAALASGYIAASSGLRPQPFYLGVVLALAGLLASLFLVRESQGHADQEALLQPRPEHGQEPAPAAPPLSFAAVLRRASYQDRTLFAVNQAGLANNLNDGMAWGLLPIYYALAGLSIQQIGLLSATYPAVWGLAQLGTGALSDRLGRKPLIVCGMLLQSAAIFAILLSSGFMPWMGSAIALGLGTALVYPTLLAAIGDVAHPSWRASAVGIYRLWRDSGYVVGALLAGLLSDVLGIGWAVGAIGLLTLLAGVIAALAMRETLAGSPAPA